MLRSSSGRTACASRANGSSMPQHLAHADVTQRHDLHRKPRRQRARRVAELRRDVAAHRGRLRHDHVHAAALDHRRAVHAQQRFQRRRQRFARNARTTCGWSPCRRPRDRSCRSRSGCRPGCCAPLRAGRRLRSSGRRRRRSAATGGRRRHAAAGLLAPHDHAACRGRCAPASFPASSACRPPRAAVASASAGDTARRADRLLPAARPPAHGAGVWHATRRAAGRKWPPRERKAMRHCCCRLIVVVYGSPVRQGGDYRKSRRCHRRGCW